MERGMKLDKTIELKTVSLSWRQTMRDSYIHQDSRAKAQLVTRIFDTCLSFSLSFVHFSCSSWTADTAEAVSSRVGSALVPKRLQLDAVRRIEVAVWIAVSYWLVCLYQGMSCGLAWFAVPIASPACDCRSFLFRPSFNT